MPDVIVYHCHWIESHILQVQYLTMVWLNFFKHTFHFWSRSLLLLLLLRFYPEAPGRRLRPRAVQAEAAATVQPRRL